MDDKPRLLGFVSYSRGEHESIDRLIAALEGIDGLDPKWHEPDAAATSADGEARATALAASDAIVVFVGGSTDSPWANFELGVALGGERPVVPVYLSADAHREAPGMLTSLAGIDGYDREPDEVAHQIANAIRAAA
jgi:hypothetical protein